MAKISIDIDPTKNEIVLSGDIAPLQSNRFAMRYMKDYLNPRFEEDKIFLGIGGSDTNKQLSNIQMMLKKYGIEENHSETTQKILIDFYEEENKFISFSQKALNIKNNICQINEFSEFTTAVSQHLIARSLYPLQLLSAYHLAFSQNACNFSVPGAGKTSIVYGAYVYLKNLPQNHHKKVNQLLIVGPLSSFAPWELEYKECFGCKPKVKRLISGVTRNEKIEYLYSGNTAELTLISYASLASLKNEIIWFLKYNQVMVVLDEAHKAKNTDGGVTAQTVFDLSKYCRARVVLTGTPAPNGYEDLYNMFKFIWPSKNVMGFEINQLRDMTERADKSRVNRLIERISPYFIRIRKSDLNIPPATIQPLEIVKMGSFQQKIYDFIEKKYMSSFLENGIDSSSNIKELLARARITRLMQAATDPNMLKVPLYDFIQEDGCPPEAYHALEDSDILEDVFKYEANETPSKYIRTKMLIDKILARGDKVVVWAVFIHTINALKKYLAKYGIESQELYGAIPINQKSIETESDDEITREKIVQEFQRDDCPYKGHYS